MSKLITLHDFALGRDVYVNPEYIACIRSYSNSTQVIFVSSFVEVRESPKEVLSIIEDTNIESNGL